MKKLLISALVGFGAIYSASSASAAITFEFNIVISGVQPKGGPVFARLVIENRGANTVDLTLTHSADPALAGKQALHSMKLNVDPFISGIVLTSFDPRFKDYEFKEDGKGDSGGDFDSKINFQIGGKETRFLAGDTVVMTATAAGLTEDHFNAVSAGSANYLGLVHFITIPPDGNSSKVTAVPEPASLMALGLGALALIRRRKLKA